MNVDESSNIPTLRRGAEGELVKSLQEYLNDTQSAGLIVDGKFGAKTEEAVKVFQRAHSLTADGIVGPKTWAVIGNISESNIPNDHLSNVMVSRDWLESIINTLEDIALNIHELINLK